MSRNNLFCTYLGAGIFKFHPALSSYQRESQSSSDSDGNSESNSDGGYTSDSDGGFGKDPDVLYDIETDTLTYIGDIRTNEDGGVGDFFGKNHEYFLYCGNKYPEIAIARRNKKTKRWENLQESLYFREELKTQPVIDAFWSTEPDNEFIFKLTDRKHSGWAHDYLKITISKEGRLSELTACDKEKLRSLRVKRQDRATGKLGWRSR